MRTEGRPGDVAVVTGSSGAIGSAVVDELVGRGLTVIGMDMISPAPERAGLYTHLGVDVRNTEVLREAAASITGGVRVVVGVAGGAMAEEAGVRTMDELTVDTVWRSLELNLVSQYSVVKELLPALRRHAGAPASPRPDRSVTVVASVNGLIGMDMPAYSAAKGGLVAMVRTVAGLLGPEGIRVNAVAPGTVPTPRTERIWARDPDHFERLRRQSPLGRLVTPAEVAASIASLAVDLTGVTGQTLVVDAGQTSVWTY